MSYCKRKSSSLDPCPVGEGDKDSLFSSDRQEERSEISCSSPPLELDLQDHERGRGICQPA
jgi:hypothetical protein